MFCVTTQKIQFVSPGVGRGARLSAPGVAGVEHV